MRSRHKNRESRVPEYLLIALCFCVCLAGAAVFPMEHCPDEAGRYQLANWIYTTGTLPTGNERETIIVPWGFSYALRPYLPAIVSALFMRLASFFTASEKAIFVASRLGSVFAMTACCCFVLKIGRRLFQKRSSALLMAALVCFLPQAAFLGMYHNNDIFGLLAAAMMLYFLLSGYDTRWSVRSCAGLGVSMSIALLSYYSVYSWLPACVFFCAASVLTDKSISHKTRLILKRSLLIAGICLVLAGWFFIRNALLHDGDLFGLVSEQRSRRDPTVRQWLREAGSKLHKYYSPRNNGLTIIGFLKSNDYEFLRWTTQSFVGVFGYMVYHLPGVQYGLYYSVFAFGIIFFCAGLFDHKLSRRDALLLLAMALACGVAFALHFWASYTRDYQPQGRYVISMILPLAYITARAADGLAFVSQRPGSKLRPWLSPSALLIYFWLCMFARAAVQTMSRMLE